MSNLSPRRVNQFTQGWQAFYQGIEYSRLMPPQWRAGWLAAEGYEIEQNMRERGRYNG